MEDLISYKMSSFVAIGKYISITIDIILSYMQPIVNKRLNQQKTITSTHGKTIISLYQTLIIKIIEYVPFKIQNCLQH